MLFYKKSFQEVHRGKCMLFLSTHSVIIVPQQISMSRTGRNFVVAVITWSINLWVASVPGVTWGCYKNLPSDEKT